MAGPIKLDLDEDGEVVEHKDFIQETAAEEAEYERKLYEKDPEAYVYKCFHGKKCKHVKMVQEPAPSMVCLKNGKNIDLKTGCPLGLWYKIERAKKTHKEDWYSRNRRLHYEGCAKAWEKRYGSTRKLPDYIVAGMRSSNSPPL